MSEQPEQASLSSTPPARLTLSQAAAACGVSRSRIRRMLDAGEFPNAVQEDAPGRGTSARVWHVPVPDLLAAGLVPNRSADSPNSPDDLSEREGEQVSGQDLADLQHQLDLERERRKAAEAIAAERGRAIEGLERALRLLEAGSTPAAGNAPTHEAAAPEPTHQPQGTPEAPRASLWGRLRRRIG